MEATSHPLDRIAGYPLAFINVDGDQNSVGNWTADYADISITSADGTVIPILNGQSYTLNPVSGNGGMANLQAAPATTPITGTNGVTHFFFSDHLGSASLEFTQGGWAVSASQFAPFGAEINPQVSANHYKFTGKERDSESGLDYFGARYFGSSMGRFMSPDYSDGPDPVPFADLDNPQSLNLYSYVLNNPIDGVDDDGHDCASEGVAQANGVATASLGCRIVNGLKRLFGGSDADKPDPGPLPPGPNSGPPGVPEGAPGTATGPLIEAQDAARSNPRFQPTPTTTFCNMASCSIGQHAGSNMGPLMTNGVPNLANTDADTLAHSGNYHRVGPAEAQRLANLGKVVYGVYKEPGHGHIITVRPNNGPYTGSGTPSTGTNDPIINDIGRHIGVYPLSQQSSAGFRNGVIFYAPN